MAEVLVTSPVTSEPGEGLLEQGHPAGRGVRTGFADGRPSDVI